MEKRLHRSRSDRKLAGVCGGIAEYYGWDPTLVRVAWIVLTLLGGSGILIYLIMWLVMPEAP
ncbi:PspC domain-containing protein [Rhodanobacter sp. C01]|uniref:PspC domain-containing protein n=1 Tax=Rhodanobacter sp. C01 TaxID=1945856 RepID=UPI0009842D99|nr:PspC domain-containing protein [Rhodanobacter sp. C01]OOG47172.1 PspC family transcriptional regulator [Rhodanobacter sp. C01]